MSKLTVQANNQGMFAVNGRNAERQDFAGQGEKKQRTTVFAGDLGMNQDSILARKQKAQREAMKMLTDVFQSDLKTDAEQSERLRHIEELQKENEDAESKLADIDKMQSDLMEEYGVTEDSEEQQELELIRKVRNSRDPLNKPALSDEEQERYDKIEERGMTEYQKRALALDDEAASVSDIISENERLIMVEEESYKDTENRKLESRPMLRARHDADELLEASRKEIIGALVEEAKEHVDEKAEEAKEAQKEKEEEKKAEEQKEAVKEAKALEQEIMIQRASKNADEQSEMELARTKARAQANLQGQISDDMQTVMRKTEGKTAELDQEIKELLAKMKLLQEDLKGMTVDDTV